MDPLELGTRHSPPRGAGFDAIFSGAPQADRMVVEPCLGQSPGQDNSTALRMTLRWAASRDLCIDREDKRRGRQGPKIARNSQPPAWS